MEGQARYRRWRETRGLRYCKVLKVIMMVKCYRMNEGPRLGIAQVRKEGVCEVKLETNKTHETDVVGLM